MLETLLSANLGRPFHARIIASVRRRGFVGSLMLAARTCRRGISPRYRSFQREELAFDRRHGIVTGVDIPLGTLQIDSPHLRYGSDYQGVSAQCLRRILHSTAIDYSRFTFVDLGAGLGRALFVAAEFPFRRVVGVEFSAELCSLAQQNSRTCRRDALSCASIEVLCIDAVDYPIPPEPVVIYMFNPFGAEVMIKVLANIADAVRRGNRDILVVYYQPNLESLFREVPFLDEVAAGRTEYGYSGYRVYRAS
jgi:SAM-dependent methyltransferase